MKQERQYYLYILASQKNGTLYIGVTNNLFQRIYQHRNKTAKSFTEKYNINKLVYYEIYQYIQDAIVREKQMKKWKRQWKLELIEENNPSWTDLFPELYDGLDF